MLIKGNRDHLEILHCVKGGKDRKFRKEEERIVGDEMARLGLMTHMNWEVGGKEESNRRREIKVQIVGIMRNELSL